MVFGASLALRDTGQATTVAPSCVTRQGWPTHNVPLLEALWRPASSESTMLPAHI